MHEQMFPTEIINSKGDGVVMLTEFEQARADHLKMEIKNAIGLDIPTSIFTAIAKKTLDQQFFTVRPSDYMPVKVSNDVWVDQILTLREFSLGDDFSTGLVNTAANNSRLAETTVAMDSVNVPVVGWAKQLTWNLFQINQAALVKNWDLVSALERSRKMNWDLGIQKTAFLGQPTLVGIYGLLNIPTVTSNTTLITKSISSMTAAEFKTFLTGIGAAFAANSLYISNPNRFYMPMSDFLGLGAAADETYNNKSKLQRLQEVLAGATNNPDFQIKGLVYSDKTNPDNQATINLNRYVLMKYDEDSVRMEIPVDYNNTAQNSVNGFHWQNVGYGRFSGVNAYRTYDIMYFDY